MNNIAQKECGVFSENKLSKSLNDLLYFDYKSFESKKTLQKNFCKGLNLTRELSTPTLVSIPSNPWNTTIIRLTSNTLAILLKQQHSNSWELLHQKQAEVKLKS